MKARTVQATSLNVLIIAQRPKGSGVARQALWDLMEELLMRDYRVVYSTSAPDGQAEVAADASLDIVLLEWELPDSNVALEAIRKRNPMLPIFLLRDRENDTDVPVAVMETIDEMVYLGEDTAPFIAGRIEVVAQRYAEKVVPVFFKALMDFNDNVHEYSWHTPGHTGGTAFLKSAAGLAFYDYFGENLLRSDLSISVDELGSLLDHSGPIGASEHYISQVFDSDRSYTVTNGTSTSNRVVYCATLIDGDPVLVDRNCHKSMEQALTLTGAVPTYLMPLRNHLGLIGPIPPKHLKAAVAGAKKGTDQFALCSITNSTYDGICCNVRKVIARIGGDVDRIHFDEAWYGYARFNPLYRDHFALYGDSNDYPADAPTLFTTQSTHKLLAALSQASYIHVRERRSPISHDRFNESFMMHASTSPLYTIIASNEISAAMMDEAGEHLTCEAIREACEFRQAVWSARRELEEAGEGWFFTTFNADIVTDSETGATYDFPDTPLELLVTDQSCWTLRPGEKWHGYRDLSTDDWAILDPIKVNIVTPGMNVDGTMSKSGGIPAMLLSSYLDAKGIICEKTADFSVLFLFSIGVTNGKWATLLSTLLAFKRDYDANTMLSEVIPELVEAYPERYEHRGLRDLADEMFDQMKTTKQTDLLREAFSQLPKAEMTPRRAYTRLVHDKVEQIKLDDSAGRILATGIVPYPPGIPLLMPGENIGTTKEPFIDYLSALQSFDRKFPGFEHDIHGVETKDGDYYFYVLKEEAG